jgi:hypothetical protein
MADTDEQTRARAAYSDQIAREMMDAAPPGLVGNYLQARLVVAVERLTESLNSSKGF